METTKKLATIAIEKAGFSPAEARHTTALFETAYAAEEALGTEMSEWTNLCLALEKTFALNK